MSALPTRPVTWRQRHSSRTGLPMPCWRASTGKAQAQVTALGFADAPTYTWIVAEYGPWGGDGTGFGTGLAVRGESTDLYTAIAEADLALRARHLAVKW